MQLNDDAWNTLLEEKGRERERRRNKGEWLNSGGKEGQRKGMERDGMDLAGSYTGWDGNVLLDRWTDGKELRD